VIEERYGNLFEMYERITDENPYVVPMRIYPAVHYTMGGLWVDYNLMSNVPGLFVLGEANFSDHGANRLGASALMQGLADGYFVLPNTINDYLAPLLGRSRCRPTTPRSRKRSGSVDEQVRKMLSSTATAPSTTSTASSARSVGQLRHGPHRAEPREGALEIPAIREEFWKNVRVLGENETRNQSLEKAGRVADFLEFGELMVLDALHRNESCGGHFREEYQTEEGEALRDDENFATSPRGSSRASAPSRSCTRSRSSSSTSTRRPVRTSSREEEEELVPENMRTSRSRPGARPARRPARSRPTTCPASAPTCRSSRCSTS
jgi:succinate dehydrogenase / fumarate reductase flavoprotein subunit